MIFTPSFVAGVAVVLSLASMVTAHPGEHLSARQIEDEMGNAHVVNMMNTRALDACQNDPEVKARKERALARRAATFARLRKERDLEEGKPTSNLTRTRQVQRLTCAQQPGFTEETPPRSENGQR